MALFGLKKNTKEKTTEKAVVRDVARDVSKVILGPVVTEKAAQMGDQNVYAFVVSPKSTKYDVRDAVQKIWKVTPVKINMVTRKPRKIVVRAKNRVGTQSGQKKAYVYLRDGDRIDLV